MKHFGKLGGILGIIAGVLPQIPGVPPYITYIVGALSGIALYLAKAPDGLTPSASDPLDNLGPVAGKLAGEAAEKASKGPFTK